MRRSALTLLEQTQKPEVQHELSELIFRMYFEEGVFPDTPGLAACASKVGLDHSAITALLESGSGEAAVQREAAAFAAQGVNAVPFFIINGTPVCSGAQSEDFFLSAFAAEAQRGGAEEAGGGGSG
jgi:predicted DsbA family dithiol-disulfide isomerase